MRGQMPMWEGSISICMYVQSTWFEIRSSGLQGETQVYIQLDQHYLGQGLAGGFPVPSSVLAHRSLSVPLQA